MSELKVLPTDILIEAVLVYVGKIICLEACESKNKKELESWWKRKIKKNGFKKHIKYCKTSPERRGKEQRKI